MSRSLLSVLMVIACIQVIFYLVAVFFRTDKVTDLAYGGTFVVLALWGYLQSEQSLVHTILMACIVIWGLRLGAYLLIRILKIGKDKRFDEMRNDWKSFGKFRLLQTISIRVVFLPAVFLFQYDGYAGSNMIFLGGIIWLIGFLLETIADQQKYTYKIQHPHHWVNTGVWKYARHPNYLGEMLVWRGVFLVVAPILISRQWLSIISPLFIMVLLLFISGIPLLEKQHDKKYGHDDEYLVYKKSTRLLLPIPK